MKTWRVAGIGDYGHFPAVLREWEERTEVELTGWAPAVEGDAPDRWLASGVNRGRARAFDRPENMLREAAPDIVIVSARLDRIAPMALLAAEAGCALVCEKPLALEQAALESLWAAISRSGKPLCMMFSMRSHPALLAARAAVRQGAIGRLVLLQAWKSYGWGSRRPEWYGQRACYGGTMLWVGIHALDMIQYVSGLAFTRAAGMHGNLYRPERPECEDHAVMIMELEGGVHAAAQLDYYRPAAAREHGNHGVRIVGTKGEITADAMRGECLLQTEADEEPRKIPLPPKGQVYGAFLDHLMGKEATPLHTTREAFLLSEAALAARDAADRGTVLPLDAARWNGENIT